MNEKDLIIAHTRRMVGAAMGYALAKLSEDPGWLRTLNLSGSLADALGPDADIFMNVRGRFASEDLLNDLKAVA